MISSKTFLLVSVFFLCAITHIEAQGLKAFAARHLIFSAVSGSQSRPDSVSLPEVVKSVKLLGRDSSAFKIVSALKDKLIIIFHPSPGFVGISQARLRAMNASGKSVAEIPLTGLSSKGLEGEKEPPLSLVLQALGYRLNNGWKTLSNHIRPELQGEEIRASLFKKAGTGEVEIIPVARYSPDFELPFGYFKNMPGGPDQRQVGILAKAGAYPEHQTLFPALASGSEKFDPGNEAFGLYATGPTHSAYSDDAWNILLYTAYASHATRIYPLKDIHGIVKNTYLLCFEEAKNGDYNDYVFLLKNVVPQTADPFQTLFNGKNLNGWHTFLNKIGRDKDPDNNFRIVDSSLHVIGKGLGYAITEKGYKNFHFKVDFKWGERRWPPRETNKRDAGICYNIPLAEPDSIWPRSVECQIQEGDVGDFWLLGFTTIKVNGVANQPMNHARMVKQKDAEKPTGEWNTVEVISGNGKCVHIVNGVVVNVGEEASVKEGRILLQSEYAEVYYKNVKIRQL